MLLFFRVKIGRGTNKIFLADVNLVFVALLIFSFFTGHFSLAQFRLTGRAVNEVTGRPLPLAKVIYLNSETQTDFDGKFAFEVPKENASIEISAAHFSLFSKFLDIESMEDSFDMGEIKLEKSIDILSFDLQELQQSEDDEDLGSGNLSAYRDTYSNFLAFDFRQINFNRRAFDQTYTNVSINKLKVNDNELNRPLWSWWGGLNDAFRYQTNTIGSEYIEVQPSSVGGSTDFDLRPSNRSKSFRASKSLTNFSYITRSMFSYSSGKNTKGTSILLNGSLRWGDDTFFKGVFYEAISGFLAVEQKISPKYSVALTSFYAPVNRAGRTTITEEEAILAPEKKHYNPYWGFQNGKVRHSRVTQSRQPFFMLSQYFDLNEKLKIQSHWAYRFGTFGRTRLNWQNQRNPRPNFFRNLPSSFENGSTAQALATERFQNDNNYNQIDWENLYDVNRFIPETTINNVGGTDNSITGRRAGYILENQINEDQQILGNIYIDHQINEKIKLTTGAYYSQLKRSNYKELNDLLGGEFWVDVDQFLEFDFAPFSNETQNNLDNPNPIIREGDRFGWDYEINSSQSNVFGQIKKSSYPLEYYLSIGGGMASYFREGNYRKGIFPDNSLGKSETQSFFEYQSNAGFTYYFNGRQSLIFNGLFQENAPVGEIVFPQARNNNSITPHLENEKIFGGDLSFQHQGSKFKLKGTFYYTRISDRTERRLLLLDSPNDELLPTDFLSVTIQDMKLQHMGLEVGTSYKISSTLETSAAFLISENEYRNNPTLFISNDNPNDAEGVASLSGSSSYFRNLDIPFNPQYVFAGALEYRNPKFWFARISANYFARSFIAPNPLNRTVELIDARIQANPTIVVEDLVRQEELDTGFNLNLGGGKSWRFRNRWYLSANLFVNNLLDNVMQTWGFEQTRYEPNFGYFNKYSYNLGRTFFLSISLRH